jgi:uncharacterized protein (TIGR02611 family)
LAARITLRGALLWVLRSMRRLAVTIVGVLLVLLGAIMIITPGPGWLTIFAGLGVLSTEYTWARRALHYCKARYGDAKDKVKERKRRRNTPPSPEL